MHVNEQAKAVAGGSYRFEMPVRWGDLDALLHVNNTVYHRYMEEARVHFLRDAGIGFVKADRNIVLAHTACDFLRPVGWPATLLIDMQLLRIGRSSLEYQAEISISGDAGGPCMRARNVIVGTDAGTERPSPWTSDELQGLERVFATRQG